MSRLGMGRAGIALAAIAATALGACHDGGQNGGQDAAPDLSLPPEVTHVGVTQPVCCLETTSSAWRVMYLASPKPGGSDSRGNDVATKGELHLADAYGGDFTLATEVPRGGYTFSPDGHMALFLSPTGDRDGSYSLMFAPLAADTLGAVTPVSVIDRGLVDRPLDEQAFFSPTGRYLIIGVGPKGVAESTDLTVVEVATARVLTTLPNGSFNYLELVTSSDVMVFQNSTASKTLGTPSLQGLYVLPLASAGAGAPARIDTRTVQFQTTADEQRIVYSRFDATVWMYDLRDKSRVQIAADVVAFPLGGDANGPLVWIGRDLAVHVAPILQAEMVATAPKSTNPWSSFQFSPSGQDLYFFDRASSQDNNGDLYRLDLKPGHTTQPPGLIDRRVSESDFFFIGGRMRYLRGIDGRGDVGELVSANLDGSDPISIARGVPTGSLEIANPVPVEQPPYKGQPPRGPIDMTTPIVPPVYAHLVNATRDTTLRQPLFDESEPIVGALAFSRNDDPPVILDPAVHVGGYRFTPDGYVLLYAGGATLNSDLQAYLGTLRLFQTLVDQTPVTPVLSGVSELGRVRDRAMFVAAPGADVPGVYFVRY